LTHFTDFGLARPIMTALDRERHTSPTPIQAGAIPAILAGRDLLGIAQTGTGKTAAFALPILQGLSSSPQPVRPRECRALVLAPTRELAAQVRERFIAYGAALGVRTALVIGGASIGKQRAALRPGVDILIATPGRLVDLMKQGAASLDGVQFFVLDEVDQMLDLGFIHSIRSIAAKLPAKRQNVFFSATMPPAIAKLASSLLNNPARVEIAATKALKIDQRVMFLEKPAKSAALIEVVKKDDFQRGLVFTRTKHGADKLVRVLTAAGATAHAIHGNRSQSQRERALAAFRKGHTRILVATDIAARGIDVSDVTHVVNYDLPNTPETYTHRIGRTGRAGAAGVALSFCSSEERSYLKAIERLTRQSISVVGGGEHRTAGAKPSGAPANRKRRKAKKIDRSLNSSSFMKDLLDSSEKDPLMKSGNDNGENGAARTRRRRHRGASGGCQSRRAG